jgi:2-amino-4-hydroxy-6-hydroxymethyldihydropteridine diphosphokinase
VNPFAVSVGANLGDRVAALQGALDALMATPGVTVTGFSAVYETDPVGGPEQPAYLNAVFVGETTLEPHALLTCAQSIETDWHRTREVRWGPRTLDIDIITMGAFVVTSDALTLPHPRAHERAFVCRPLLDADPSARIGDQSVAEIMTTLSVDGVWLTDFTLDAGWGER